MDERTVKRMGGVRACILRWRSNGCCCLFFPFHFSSGDPAIDGEDDTSTGDGTAAAVREPRVLWIVGLPRAICAAYATMAI